MLGEGGDSSLHAPLTGPVTFGEFYPIARAQWIPRSRWKGGASVDRGNEVWEGRAMLFRRTQRIWSGMGSVAPCPLWI